MSLLAVAAGKDTRGVTTACLALGAVWPTARPLLLAECDPAGGTLAARFGLPATPGLVSLASAGRRGLSPAAVAGHLQRLPAGGLDVLLGTAHAEQATALGRLWADLAAVLGGLDGDVIADCGRLGPADPTGSVVEAAAVVLLVCEPTSEGVVHLQGRVEALARRSVTPAVVLLGQAPYGPGEVQAALAADHPAVAVLGVLARDPAAAALLGGRPGSPRRLARSLLVRSARAVAGQLHARLHPPPAAPAADDGPVDAASTPAGVDA